MRTAATEMEPERERVSHFLLTYLPSAMPSSLGEFSWTDARAIRPSSPSPYKL